MMRQFLILGSTAALLAACAASNPEAASDTPSPDAEPSSASGALVDGLAGYIGVWESEDGAMRQVFRFVDGETAVEACIRFPDDAGGWRNFSQGRYQAVGAEIHGSFTGENMDFERLDVIGYPVGGGGGVDWVNTAITAEGEQRSYETWAPPLNGAFTYVVERMVEGRREFWFSGEWRYRNDLEPSCA